jgi:CelD/BcsL family acetyltransferase involved in cellulose biosynthesis
MILFTPHRSSIEGPELGAFAARLPVRAAISPLVSGAAIPQWWEPLSRSSCNGSVFLSSAWMQSWLEVYGNDFQGQWIRWEHERETVGGCLLVSRIVWKRCIPMRSLYLNATGEVIERAPLAEFNDILHVPGYGEAIAADFARLVQTMAWDRLLLSGYEERGVLDRLIPLLPAAEVHHEPRAAPYVDIAALPEKEFMATLTGKAGNHIRRNFRLHEEEHGELSVTTASSLEQAMQYFREMAILHNARWKSKGQDGSFSSPAVVDFHQRLIKRLWPGQTVDLVCVRGTRSIIGYLYNFIAQGKVYFFQSGFTYQDNSKLSPGLLTHSISIEHYRQRGFREYDMLAGDARYKRALAKDSRTLHWTVVYRDRIWIRAALWLRATLARLTSRSSGMDPEGSAAYSDLG